MKRLAVAAGLALLVSACGGGGGGGNSSLLSLPGPQPTAQPTVNPIPAPATNPIQHVVVIIQENRSFDNLFAGFPGADTAMSGKMSNGQTVALTEQPLEVSADIQHSHINFEREYANGNLYFDLGAPSGIPPTFPYGYVPRSETAPLWNMASQYVLADRMFTTNSGPSLPAHLFLLTGQSGSVAENPTQALDGVWGCDSPPGTTAATIDSNGNEHTGGFPCYDFPTLSDELDAKGISWRYYAAALHTFGGIWSTYDAIKHIRYGTDWTNYVISPETRILTDASSTLPTVTWVTPSAGNSDHSGSNSNTGPQWVASVVNAIGESPNWKNTAIFILWDDWGGWFDHVPPPQLDVMGLGFRVPLIVVSPYAKHGYVSHVQHEFGSILHFIEKTYTLPNLSNIDVRADDLSDVFDFTQTPRAFTPITARRSAFYFLHQKSDGRVPDND